MKTDGKKRRRLFTFSNKNVSVTETYDSTAVETPMAPLQPYSNKPNIQVLLTTNTLQQSSRRRASSFRVLGGWGVRYIFHVKDRTSQTKGQMKKDRGVQNELCFVSVGHIWNEREENKGTIEERHHYGAERVEKHRHNHRRRW